MRMFGGTPATLANGFVIAIAMFAGVLAVGWGLKNCNPTLEVKNAVRKGDFNALRRLLDANPALVNARDSEHGATPLHWAAIEGNWKLADLLLELGADINATDRHGMTPLHKAAAFGQEQMVVLLLVGGADPDPLARKYARIIVTPLDLAAEAGYRDMVRLLVENGAGILVPKPPETDVSALHLAAGKGRFDVVRYLLECGVDPNVPDLNNRTALAWAQEMEKDALSIGKNPAPYRDVQDLLRIYGGTLKATPPSPTQEGWPPS